MGPVHLPHPKQDRGVEELVENDLAAREKILLVGAVNTRLLRLSLGNICR